MIPGTANAKVSMRLVPGMDPGKTAAAFVNFVKQVTPRFAESQVEILHTAPAMLVETNSPAVQAAAEAFHQTFHKNTIYVRCGGSIPIAATFKEVLNVPILITGFALPNANMHAPNESIDVGHFHLGTEAIGRYFQLLS